MIVQSAYRLLTASQVIMEAALSAGSRAYFACPSPFHALLLEEGAQRFQQKHGSFIQAESPASALAMALGAAVTSCLPLVTALERDFLEMQEVLCWCHVQRRPLVLVLVANGPPGQTHTQIQYHSLRYFFEPVLGLGQPLLCLLPCSLQSLWNQTLYAFQRTQQLEVPVILLLDPWLLQQQGRVQLTRQWTVVPAATGDASAEDPEIRLLREDGGHLWSDVVPGLQRLWLAAGVVADWIRALREPGWGMLIPEALSPFPARAVRQILAQVPNAELCLPEPRGSGWEGQMRRIFPDLHWRTIPLPGIVEPVGLRSQLYQVLESSDAI